MKRKFDASFEIDQRTNSNDHGQGVISHDNQYIEDIIISEIHDQDKISSFNECTEDENIFMSEICSMMYTFGDVKEPKQESVLLMRAIVREQMNYLLLAAEEAVYIRDGSEISHQDLLFLMRKNKVKLKCLLEYLNFLDEKSSLLSIIEDDYGSDLRLKRKRVETCLKFLAEIEDCEEFTSLVRDKAVSEIITKRMMRRHWMANSMDIDEYKEFSEKITRASFCPSQKIKRFKNWLLQDQATTLDLTPLAVIIINFLARETIAEIVDLALVIKMKKLGKNPRLLYGNVSTSTQFFQNHSELNLETCSSVTAEEFENVSKEDNDRDQSICINTNKIYATSENGSANQMIVNEEENFEACKEQNIVPSKIEEDSEPSMPQIDHSVHSSPKSACFDEDIAQDEGSVYREISERSDSRCRITSDSDSNLEIRSDLGQYYETIDDSEAPENKLEYCKASSEAESNSILEKHAPNHLQEEKIALSDISDEGNIYNLDSVETDKSNEMRPGADILNYLVDSSQNSPFCPMLGSEGTLHGTPVAGASVQSQETNFGEYQFGAVSDTPDTENFPEEIMARCKHTRTCKRKSHLNISVNSIRKDPIVNASVDCLSIAESNEIIHQTAIEPIEIREAFVCFQEPSQMVCFFSNDEIPRKTKLICLTESSFNNGKNLFEDFI